MRRRWLLRRALTRIANPAVFAVAAIAALAGCVGLASPVPSDASCPLNFSATAIPGGGVSFHWSGFGGADGYQVFGNAGLANTAGYSPVLSGDARDSSRTDLAPGPYVFWVDAYHSETIVASSCHRSVELTGPGPEQGCPLNVTAQPHGSSVVLAWTAIENATGYSVARAVSGGPFVDDFATTGPMAEPRFVDHNTTAGTTYYYRVTMLGAAAETTCDTVPATLVDVPFFPTATSMWAGAIAVAFVSLVLVRRRK